MNSTIAYYDKNAHAFASGTVSVDFLEMQKRFLDMLEPGAYILDFGCGSGRDVKFFLEQGYRVDAIDGSKELCRIASEYAGTQVRHMLFQDLNEIDKYDAIWACSSILHLSKVELHDVMERMSIALVSGGIIYTSFKYGEFEGERNGRYFTDFTMETFAAFIKDFGELEMVDKWLTGDVRPGRGMEKWLNVILRKK